MSEIKDLLNKYVHFCDDCPKAYDFTCSGSDAEKCGKEKQEILDKIQFKKGNDYD